MNIAQRIAAVLSLVVCSFTANTAIAGASGSIVLDPSNLAQNTQQAVQSVKQVTTQINSYITQLAQYKVMVNDIRGFDVATVLKHASPEVAATIRQLDRARSDLNGLEVSLRNMDSRVQQRYASANRASMTVPQYYSWLMAERNKGNLAAAKSVKQDQEIIKSTQGRLKQIQDWDANMINLVNNASGAHMQMSSQLGVVAASLNQMQQFMAEKSAKQTEDIAFQRSVLIDEELRMAEKDKASQDAADAARRAQAAQLRNMKSNK